MTTAETSGVRERSVVHSTFTVERVYDATPARVFAAWSDPVAKARWFGPPDGSADGHEMDFRPGGRERLVVSSPDATWTFESRYEEIVPDERIVHSYVMDRDELRVSASIATIQLFAEGDGTRLVLTEQGAFLDGQDTPAAREHGTRELLEVLAGALDGA